MAALSADAGLDRYARLRHHRRPLSPARCRRPRPAAPGHGPRHAAAEASARALRCLHVRGLRVHRPRPGDRDDGGHRAGGAGARAVHLPADAHHRRRCRPSRDAAGLGAASLLVLSWPLRCRNTPGVRHGQRAGRGSVRRPRSDRDRRCRRARRREDVPLGREPAICHDARQGLGGRRARRVDGRRDSRRNSNASATVRARDGASRACGHTPGESGAFAAPVARPRAAAARPRADCQ